MSSQITRFDFISLFLKASPTSNDFPCDLPFNISDSTDNYYCVKNDTDPIVNYQCVTGNQEIANCNLGNVLRVNKKKFFQ